MKGAHREGKDSASCGHRSAGGCPTVLINGFPAMRAYGDSDRAGGQLLGPGAKNVFVGNARLSLVGDTVLPHGRGKHASATIATGSPDVLATPNPPVDSWKVDEFAGANIGQLASDVMTIAKGIWSVFPMMIQLARENPEMTLALLLVCVVFPQVGVLMAAAGGLTSFFKLGNAMLKVSKATTEAERQDALREVGQALGELGLSFGPKLSGFLGKHLKPEVLARVGALFQKLLRSKGSPQQVLEAVKGLWNTPFVQGIRNIFSKEPQKVLPPQRRTSLPQANSAEIPALLRGLGVRKLPLPAEMKLSVTQQRNYNTALSILPYILPPNSKIKLVQAFHGGNREAMAILWNSDDTATLLLNVDFDIIKDLPGLIRDSPISTYGVRTGLGKFWMANRSDADLIRFIFWHEVGHSQFFASRSTAVANASKAKTLAEFQQAIKELPATQRIALLEAWGRFRAARNTVGQTVFTRTAWDNPAEFYAEYTAAYKMGWPIPEEATKMFAFLYGPGGAMAPTKGPRLPL